MFICIKAVPWRAAYMTPQMETVTTNRVFGKKFGSQFRQYWSNLYALLHKVLCENVEKLGIDA